MGGDAAAPAPGRNVVLTAQYDGTDFAGWQAQPRQRTVQGELTRALEAMTGEAVTLHGSSRTDAGVHARALPVSFETARDIPLLGFVRGLNGVLPADLAVLEAREAPLGWRPRDAAVAKTYRYALQVGETRLPLLARTSWHVRRPALDLDAMAEAAAALLGEHDFAAFRATGCDSRTTTRRLYAVEIRLDAAWPLVHVVVTGNAFLRNMVRILAGTLAEVGMGRRPAGSMGELLARGRREEAGRTAPARGLVLERVHFEGYPRLGKPGPPPGHAQRGLDGAEGDC